MLNWLTILTEKFTPLKEIFCQQWTYKKSNKLAATNSKNLKFFYFVVLIN